MSKCGICQRNQTKYGVTVYGRFIGVCSVCARRVAELYHRVYEW